MGRRHQGAATAARYEPPRHYGLRRHAFLVQPSYCIERLRVSGYEVLAAIGILGIDRRRKAQWIVTHLPTGIAITSFPSMLKAAKWCAQVYCPLHYAYWKTTDVERLRNWLAIHRRPLEARP